MYIIKNGSDYAFSDNANGAIARIASPIIEENGKEFTLDSQGSEYNGFSYTEKKEEKGDGLFYLSRTFTNNGTTDRTVKFIYEAVTAFTPAKYLIPCVSYNGNYWGEGLEPKGMIADNGEPWIHSYDRTPIPSCSITETKDLAFSLFVSGETVE